MRATKCVNAWLVVSTKPTLSTPPKNKRSRNWPPGLRQLVKRCWMKANNPLKLSALVRLIQHKNKVVRGLLVRSRGGHITPHRSEERRVGERGGDSVVGVRV